MFGSILILLICFLRETQAGAGDIDIDLPLHAFGSKTAYRNLLRTVPETLPPGCQPLQLLMVLRHGARTPSTKQVRKVEVLRHRLASSFTADSYFKKVVNGWSNPFGSAEKDLSAVGFEEHQIIGKRISKKYPDLFTDLSKVKVFSSSPTRAFASAKSFLHGAGLDELATEIKVDDSLLRFFAQCKKFIVEIENDPKSKIEFEKFKKGKELLLASKAAQERLKLTDIDVSPSDIGLSLVICTIEIANNMTRAEYSPWCHLIHDPIMLETLEYLYDLKHYWRKSYGYEINHAISCPIIQHMKHNLELAASGKSFNSGIFYFGHAETILPIVSRFRLFKDDIKLTHDTFQIHKDTRKFRSSRIIPFSGNFAMSLLSCHRDTYVQLLVNEEPILWELCNAYMCPYHLVKQFLHDLCHEVDFETTCKLKDEL